MPRGLSKDIWPTPARLRSHLLPRYPWEKIAMSLMSMKLWTLAGRRAHSRDSTLQLVLAVLFAIFICFRVLGRNYDAAVMSGGFMGNAIGTTPTAIANMTAITQRYGPSHLAFLVVPLLRASSST